MELRLPKQKLEKLQEMVEQWRHRKSCKKRDLQVLAGHLNHACKVIRPGRRFLRGIFGLLSQFGRKDHPIRLNREFRAGNNRIKGVVTASDSGSDWGSSVERFSGPMSL